MPKVRVSLLKGRPLFDIASYARPGPGRRDRLSPAQLEQISRTARRAPEVVVKVLSKATNDLKSVRRHLAYIGRYGDLDLETDDGEHLKGPHIPRQVLDDWDLDLQRHPSQSRFSENGRKPPKLVHKLLLSMPPGTPPQGVLNAARNFLREEFALKHRYTFVLHTDEPHPHVHVVLKAVSEQGVRLHIKKATLRHWRQQFAHQLREQGIPANATERAVRGQIRGSKKDGIYRAMERGESTYIRERAESVARDLARGRFEPEQGSARIHRTRADVVRGWSAVVDDLEREGQPELAHVIRRFVHDMPPPMTERQAMADRMQHTRERGDPTR
jgi:hypothetical protein